MRNDAMFVIVWPFIGRKANARAAREGITHTIIFACENGSLLYRRPAKDFDDTNVDWAPSLHLGYGEDTSNNAENQLLRHGRRKKTLNLRCVV
ncbi:hypothetical protein B566_EDAN010017, partial [Ephemera danica]